VTAFLTQLRAAMSRRGMVRADLCRATGADSTLARRWLAGESMPDHATVVVIAEWLHWPSLVALSIALRSGTCEGCGGPTLATRGRTPPRWCGSRCAMRASDRRRHERKRLQVIGVVTRERDRLRSAVDDWCHDCTDGEGICRDGACRFRDVSRLPFVPLTAVSRRERAA
jgi:hypothetical protein